MLKTKVLDVNLTTEYAPIIPSPIKSFAMVQLQAPEGGLTYKFNDDEAEIVMETGEFFQHPINVATELNACGDVIYMKSSAPITIQIEVQHYEGEV